jgi:hypothetical protein
MPTDDPDPVAPIDSALTGNPRICNPRMGTDLSRQRISSKTRSTESAP